jgi:hypothetical protein
MTVEINKKTSKKEQETLLKKIKPKLKKLDASLFFGKVGYKGDPLKIQKELRDE